MIISQYFTNYSLCAFYNCPLICSNLCELVHPCTFDVVLSRRGFEGSRKKCNLLDFLKSVLLGYTSEISQRYVKWCLITRQGMFITAFRAQFSCVHTYNFFQLLNTPYLICLHYGFVG